MILGIGVVLIGKYGAQSVAVSGDYEDDENHGDWFIFTGRLNF